MNVAALLQDSPSDDHERRRQQQQQQQQQREREREQPLPPQHHHSPPQERSLERDSRPTQQLPHPHHPQSLPSNPAYSPHATRHAPLPSPPHRYASDYNAHTPRIAPPPPSSSSSYAPSPFETRRRSDPEQSRVHEIALHPHGPGGGHAGSSATPFAVEHRPLPPPPRTHIHHHPHQHVHGTPGAQSPIYMQPPGRPPIHGGSNSKPGSGPPGPGIPPAGHGTVPLFPTPVGPGVPAGPPTNAGPPLGPGIPPPPSRPLHSPHGFASPGMEPPPMYGAHPSASLPPLSGPSHHLPRSRTSGSFDYPRTSPIMSSLQRPPFDDQRHGPVDERRDERDRDIRDRSDRDRERERDGARGQHMATGLGGPGSLHQPVVAPGMSMNVNARVAGPGAPSLPMSMSNVLSGPGALPMVGVGAKERERDWEQRAMERERENNARERERERDMRLAGGNGGMMGESPRDRHRSLKEKDMIMRERERGENFSEAQQRERENDWLRRTQSQELMQGLPPPGQVQPHAWSRFAPTRMLGPPGPYAEDERERERRMIEMEMERERAAKEDMKMRERRDKERFVAEEDARAREAREGAEVDKSRRRQVSREKVAREKEERRLSREELAAEQERQWRDREREHLQAQRAEMERRQGPVQAEHHHHHVRHHHHTGVASSIKSKPSGGPLVMQSSSGPREPQPLFPPEHLRHSNSAQFRQGPPSKVIDIPTPGPPPHSHGQPPQHQHQHPHPSHPHPHHPHPPMHIHAIPSVQHRDTPSYGAIMHPHMPVPMDMYQPPRTSPPRKTPPVRIGTFVFPRTPFPFTDFPSASTSAASATPEPVPLNQYKATILIPSGFLPMRRPPRPRIWGGALIPALPAVPPLSAFTAVPYRDSRPHAHEARGMRRVYTDDSDLFLCALHAGLLTWSETRRGKAEGKDLRVDVKITKEVRFIGGFGSRCVHDPGFTGGGGVGVYGNQDDGSSLLSASWGNSHDGAGIEVVSATWISKGDAHKLGLRNRQQRIVEYNERRSALCDASRPRKKRRVDQPVVTNDSPVVLEEQEPDLELCTAATITFGDGRAWNQMKFKHPPTFARKATAAVSEQAIDAENIPPSSPPRKRRRSLSPAAIIEPAPPTKPTLAQGPDEPPNQQSNQTGHPSPTSERETSAMQEDSPKDATQSGQISSLPPSTGPPAVSTDTTSTTGRV